LHVAWKKTPASSSAECLGLKGTKYFCL
jgi:hypothetical protein